MISITDPLRQLYWIKIEVIYCNERITATDKRKLNYFGNEFHFHRPLPLTAKCKLLVWAMKAIQKKR